LIKIETFFADHAQAVHTKQCNDGKLAEICFQVDDSTYLRKVNPTIPCITDRRTVSLQFQQLSTSKSPPIMRSPSSAPQEQDREEEHLLQSRRTSYHTAADLHQTRATRDLCLISVFLRAQNFSLRCSNSDSVD
jgi:hypothetical protein